MNCRKLYGKIIEQFGNQSGCAMEIGISRAYLNQIVHGKRDITYTTMCKLIEALKLTDQETLDIFFPKEVAESKQ